MRHITTACVALERSAPPTLTTPCAERPDAKIAVRITRYTASEKPATVAMRMNSPEYLV